MTAKRKPVKTTGDYELWEVGKNTVKVSGTVAASTYAHPLAAIVECFVEELLAVDPGLGHVKGLLSEMLTSDSAKEIDSKL